MTDYLTLIEVLEIHADQIAVFGGAEGTFEDSESAYVWISECCLALNPYISCVA